MAQFDHFQFPGNSPTSEDLLGLYFKIRAEPTPYREWVGELFESPAFQAWHSHPPIQPFSPTFPFRINRIGQSLYLTDGFWVEKDHRVFPFSDESEDLLELIPDIPHNHYAWALDLATGCGHTSLQLAQRWPTFAYDINPRALIYSRINSALNFPLPHGLHLELRDLRDGISQPTQKRGLIVANLPFGPNPVPGTLPLTSGGGRDCLDFQTFFFEKLKSWQKEQSFQADILLIGLSFGNPETGHWQIEERLQKILNINAKWKVLSQKKIPRTNGKRELANPSDVETALNQFLNCSFYVPENTPALIQAYQTLRMDMMKLSAPSLSYGSLNFSLGD